MGLLRRRRLEINFLERLAVFLIGIKHSLNGMEVRQPNVQYLFAVDCIVMYDTLKCC